MASATVTAKPETGGRRRRRLSPLTLRVLAINVLALAILLGGLLYLGRYQDRLIDAELESLTTQARIFASAFGEGAVRATPGEGDEEAFELSPELVRQMVRRLVETTQTRTRLFTADGRLLSDSQVLAGSPDTILIEELAPPDTRSPLARLIEDSYEWLTATLPTREAFPVYREFRRDGAILDPDLLGALAGEEGATVWRAGGDEGAPELMLTVAVPVQRYKQILGAVLLSRSGQDIDDAIREVRFDILRAFAGALLVTVALSFYLAGTIAQPIRRLALAAEEVRSGHGRHAEIPDFSRRGDEIGDLSEALRAMTTALWTRMDAIERFAADVAHEIKNPLTSLRSAVETIVRVEDTARRATLMAIIADDVQRLDRLISDISNASRLDAELSRAELEPVDLGLLLAMLAEIDAATRLHDDDDGDDTAAAAASSAESGPRLVVERPIGAALVVPGLEGRLTQVFQNLVANALSFSPPGGVVRITARRLERMVEVTVADDGPGIPEGKEEAIFERFYSERPSGEKYGTHSGLGLSISRQIVAAHGGTLTAANRPPAPGETSADPVSGAIFTVRLPLGCA